jgi:hypothetical protein
MADPKNWSSVNPKDFPPPFFDDGAAGSLVAFAANTAALASGSAATAGGTEGTYPGAAAGAVPVSTSVAHEGAATEQVVTTTYPAFGGANNPAHYPLQVVASVGPNATQATRDAGPNATHPSTMSPIVNPALVSISPTTLAAAATGTQVITCTGTGFVPGCRIWHNNVEQTTTYVSATSLTATVKKLPYAQAITPVVVKLGGVIMGATANFAWT